MTPSVANSKQRIIPRLGLAARLYLAIGGAVLLTLTASLVAWVSFVQLGQDQRVITQEQIPAITQSLRLARQSALIAATVPKLLTVSSDEERKQVMSGLRDQQTMLLALVTELKDGLASAGTDDETVRARLDSIDSASASLATALRDLDRVVGEQLVLRAQMERLIADAVASHRRLSGLILPLLDDMTFFLVTGYRSLDDADPMPRHERISDSALLQYGALSDLLAEGNLLVGLLTETVSVPTVALLQPLNDRFVAAADRFQTAFNGISGLDSAQPVIEEFYRLYELGLAEDGIIDLQRQILQAQSLARTDSQKIGIIALRREIIDRMLDAQRLVEQSRALATSLTEEVELVVEGAEAGAAATAAASIRSIELGQQVLLALNVVGILGAFLLGWAYVSRSFTEPVLKVTAAAEDFERQRFDPTVLSKIAKRGDELGHLARVFLSMAEQVQARTDTLDRLVTDRTKELNSKNAALEQTLKKIADELAMAQRMQLSILPRRYPELPALEMFARMQAAREVGGDFYDIIEIDRNRVGIAIADVSDKGVPAALLMAVACTKIKAIAMQGISPAKVLEELNRTLSEDNETAMFVTVFYGVVDIAAGTLVFANGGHNSPYLLRGDAPAAPLPSTGGIALGIVPELEYEERTMTLESGDTVFLFTDGVTEAFNPAGDPFTDLKLCDTLYASRSFAVERLGRHVIEDVESHTRGAPQSDDITCVVMRYQPIHDVAGADENSGMDAKPTGAERFVARMRNDLTELARVAEEVEAFGERRSLDFKTVYNVNLILDELLTNTINYGYEDRKDHTIDIVIDHRDDVLTITVEDDAKPFDPLSVAEPDLEAALEDRAIGGLGIHIVKTFMDEVRYERVDGRNRVVMTKRTIDKDDATS
jgi:serine phosphatase RsbU (regulator of sigma subunit)/anti-sigma regulatory factor (Ser/Thr protein kinase)